MFYVHAFVQLCFHGSACTLVPLSVTKRLPVCFILNPKQVMSYRSPNSCINSSQTEQGSEPQPSTFKSRALKPLARPPTQTRKHLGNF